MKMLDIALKDMLQAFRSRTALIFMFAVPILVTAMFVFLFGGLGGDEEQTEIPTIYVQVANLDSGEEQLGEMLVEGLTNENLPIPMQVTRADGAESARQAVDSQQAGVAVLIPENFSAAMMAPEGRAEVEIYQDPTLTLGPSIVASLVNGFVDTFSGSKITLGVALEQLMASGQFFDQEDIETIINDYIAAATAVGGAGSLVAVQSPSGEEGEGSVLGGMIQLVMAGMMIFYAFFTGANMVHSIIREEEEGTLPRLFTTPTPQHDILYGKFIAAGVTVFIQALVLLVFGSLVFDFSWGPPLWVGLVVLGITVSAATFGIFLISLLKSSRQAGIALGGGVTVTGMLGMIPIFTMGVTNPPQTVMVMSHLVPQGWALDALMTTMEGGATSTVTLSLGVLLAWSAAFFLIGNQRFKRRFA